jgi:MscS family membrane protein
MKVKFQTFAYTYVFLMLSLLLWSVWAMAQDRPGLETTPSALAPGTNAPPVHRTYLTFGLDRVEYLSAHTALGVPYWQYLAVLIYLVISFYAARLIDYFIQHRLKQWAAKTKTTLDDAIIVLIEGPTRVVAFAIIFYVGLQRFAWPDWFELALVKAVTIVVGITLAIVLLKVVDLSIAHWRAKTAHELDHSFDEQLFPILRKSLKIFIVLVAAVVIADNLHIEVKGLLASLSIGGLALGLAAQDTVANLFGAVAVFVDKPFRLGDRIKLADVDGTVEAIGLRSTRVRNLDGYLVTIPNKTMGNATIVNVSRRPNIKTELNIGLVYDTPVPQVRKALAILDEVYRDHPKTFDLVVAFNKFADSWLNIQVVHLWNGLDAKEHLAAMQEMNLAVKERFDREGIDFAFPTQTLHFKPGASGPLVPQRGDAQGGATSSATAAGRLG